MVVHRFSGLCLAGNEGVEKNMDTVVLLGFWGLLAGSTLRFLAFRFFSKVWD